MTTQSLRIIRPKSSRTNEESSDGYDHRLKRTCSNPLDRLCDLLLGWDLLADLYNPPSERNEGDLPTIPTIFSCFHHYISTWEPLIIEEMRENLLSTFQTALTSPSSLRRGTIQCSPPDNITTKTFTIQCTFNTPEGERGDSNSMPGLMDLVLLSSQKLPLPSPTRSNNTTPSKALLGLIVHLSHSQGVRLLHVKISTSTYISLSHELLRSRGKEGVMTLHSVVVDSLRSPFREFQAVHEIGGTAIGGEVLLMGGRVLELLPTPPSSPCASSSSPVPPSPMLPPLQLPPGLTPCFSTYLQASLNPSQYRAVASTISNKGFSLIQGPPGTGKTTTLLCLLNALHLREYNSYYQTLLDAFLPSAAISTSATASAPPPPSPLTPEAIFNMVGKVSKQKPRLLIVAPSNVAVDNLAQRILQGGFVDGQGGKYQPPLLRVGAGGRERNKGGGSVDSKEEGKGDNGLRAIQLEFQIEQLLSLPAKKVKDQLQRLSIQRSLLLAELCRLHLSLSNLIVAFRLYPLPKGWEVRVKREDSLPYWVNHTEQCTSPQPPVYQEGERGYTRLSDLPEYLVLSHHFTQGVEKVERLTSHLSRLQALQSMQQRSSNKDFYVLRDLLESACIEETQLLCTTLNSCALPVLEQMAFSLTVVDEAAQCTEPSVMIALRRGCAQCVLVGDPQQLPPTIFSERGRRRGYDRSLFERLKEGGMGALLLDTQYRMHPSISIFPNRAFYAGKLRDAESVRERGFLPDYVQERGGEEGQGQGEKKRGSLPPFLFFDILYSQDKEVRNSRANMQERDFCLSLLEYLLSLIGKRRVSIGVLTPYSEQLSLLSKAFRSLPRPAGSREVRVEFNTVDGFQGKESDVIIFSAVRANDRQSVGFLADYRRMNVALTRAKHCLCVVGHSPTLKGDEKWGALVDHAVLTDALVRVEREGEGVEEALRRMRWYSPFISPVSQQQNFSHNHAQQHQTAHYTNYDNKYSNTNYSRDSNVYNDTKKRKIQQLEEGEIEEGEEILI